VAKGADDLRKLAVPLIGKSLGCGGCLFDREALGFLIELAWSAQSWDPRFLV
jgi:hypothetical protein